MRFPEERCVIGACVCGSQSPFFSRYQHTTSLRDVNKFGVYATQTTSLRDVVYLRQNAKTKNTFRMNVE